MRCEKEIEVVNKLGLHARAAAKLVNLANVFVSSVMLDNGEREVDAASIMHLMMLAAGKGTALTVRTDGEDAEQAMTAVQDLFARYFDEGE
ncbi:MAG: HPr family phosphocarrier protein [Arenicellales bacterium WSBS_2016_MAG_OTU3]